MKGETRTPLKSLACSRILSWEIRFENPIKLVFGPNSGEIWLKFTSQMTVEALYPLALLTWVTRLAEDVVLILLIFLFLLHGFVFKLHCV